MTSNAVWQFDYEQCPLSELWVYKFDDEPADDGQWRRLNAKSLAVYRIVEGTMQFVAFAEAVSEADRREILQKLASCGPLEIKGSTEIVIRRKGGRYDMWSHWVYQDEGVELTGFTKPELSDAYHRLLELEGQF